MITKGDAFFMSNEKVQILMAVFNGAQFIQAQIDSLCSQTYADWELLVSDDNSSDSSLSIIRDYCKRDSRIRLVLDGVHAGSAKQNFMNLLKVADADYVMFCDQDDIWDSNKIELTLHNMKCKQATCPSSFPILLSTDLRVVDQDLNLIADSFLKMTGLKSDKTDFGYFMSSYLVTGCTMMINRPLLLLVQDAKPNIDAILMHDWWLSLIASSFGCVSYINEQTISYRQHAHNSVGAQRRSLVDIVDALTNMSRVHQNAIKTILQVDEFNRLYGNNLSDECKNQMEAYLSLRCAKIWEIIPCLCRAKAWRCDFISNLGLILAFVWRW